MKLLTAVLRRALPRIGGQENVKDPIVHVKFFGGSACTWFITEFDGEDEMFGFACLGDPEMAELGYISFRELESLRFPPFGLRLERDLYWTPKPLSEAKKGLGL